MVDGCLSLCGEIFDVFYRAIEHFSTTLSTAVDNFYIYFYGGFTKSRGEFYQYRLLPKEIRIIFKKALVRFRGPYLMIVSPR